MGCRLTRLNKNHLKNVMVFVSKLFNGVNADHQNLQKLSLTAQALCHSQRSEKSVYQEDMLNSQIPALKDSSPGLRQNAD
jgi:hypothetical protein